MVFKSWMPACAGMTEDNAIMHGYRSKSQFGQKHDAGIDELSARAAHRRRQTAISGD